MLNGLPTTIRHKTSKNFVKDKRAKSLVCCSNPLLRWISSVRADPPPQQQLRVSPPATMERLRPREYQKELIKVASNANVLVALPTGSGKTLIAAEIIQQKAAALKAAGKYIIFLAPTNPLVEQQCNEILIKKHGLKAIAFHGDINTHKLSNWNAESWHSALSKVDVAVMTPQILVLALNHGAILMKNIGLLIFDEAHHCDSNHPYNQIMQDFYRHGPSSSESRPQILALTASPKGLEGSSKNKNSQEGLQYRLGNARVVTVADQCRSELQAQVPVPSNKLVPVNDMTWSAGPAAAAAAQLEQAQTALSAAAACEGMLYQLQRQAMLVSSGQMKVSESVAAELKAFTSTADHVDADVARIDKQFRAVRTCLIQLGPWAAAAAAYLDLLAGRDNDDVSGSWTDSFNDKYNSGNDKEAVEVPTEGEDDQTEDGSSSAAAAAAAGSSVLPESDLWKHMMPDHLDRPEDLLDKFRDKIVIVHNWLQQISASHPSIIKSTDLDKAMAAAAAPGSSSSGVFGITAAGWSAAVGGLLSLMSKAAVLMMISVLADLLITDDQARSRFINDSDLQAAAGDSRLRADGGLRSYAKMLMEQVSFATLQAQIFPHLPSSSSAPVWSGSALLSPKVVKLIQHLEYQRMEQDDGSNRNNNGDWWAVIVFVETKLATLVLHKLLRSLPDVSKTLRAGYLVGDTDYGSGAGSSSGNGLSMSNKAQAAMVQRFRTGELNVLVATNIGNEGLDFKQCQAVVAFDPPTDVTCYIQARGRARKPGSYYYWLAPDSLELDHKTAISTKLQNMEEAAQRLDDLLQQWSQSNRLLLQQQQQQSGTAAAAVVVEPYDPLIHFPVPSGGVATLRQAQVLLAAFCARLPGSTSGSLLQAYYTTKLTSPPRTPSRFTTTVHLPSNSGILQPLHGPEHSKKSEAKSAAALEAIKKLFEMKKLDEYLQPAWVSNKRSQQLEAEPIPKFTYDFSLEFPLAPRTVNFTLGDASRTGKFTPSCSTQTVTLHLHHFELKGSSSSSSTGGEATLQRQQQQQQHLSGSKRPLTSATESLQKAQNALQQIMQPGECNKNTGSSSSNIAAQLTELLNLAVGSLDRCAAVPGSSSTLSSSSSSSSSSKELSFGVLLWEPLSSSAAAGGSSSSDDLHWPAWTHQQQQQPYQVSLVYDGPVTFTAAEVLQLMHYQQAVDTHINWSSKRLLGVKPSDHQQQQQQHLRPFQPEVFQQLTADWKSPLAAAAAASRDGSAASGGGADNAAAAQLLEGAQICYLFVPLRQQQQQHMINWDSIQHMSQGLNSFSQLAAEVCQTPLPPAAAAAAAASLDQFNEDHIHALNAQLHDRIVIAGHSSMMYRCTGITPEMTLRTPAEFEWKGSRIAAAAQTANASSSSSSSITCTARTHAEYYSKRYNIRNLNPDLPMMSVAGGGQGWKKGLGLVTNTLKPPVLQNRVSKGLEAAPRDLTSPEAAAAAVKLFGVSERQQQQHENEQQQQQQQQQQQRRQEYLPLELCWILPLTAAAWSELLLLPAFMYRINALLRVRRMQQHLQQQAQCTAASSSSGPRFLVPDRALLLVALTGSSAGEVFDQEGLEYLGDVVLKFLATNYLLQSESLNCNEGELSVKKARMIRNVQLAAAAQQQPLLLQQHLHLLSFQQTGTDRGSNKFTPTGCYPRSAAAAAAATAAAAAAAAAGSSEFSGPVGLYDGDPRREEKGKRLADGVEALIGAVYLTAAAAAGDLCSTAAAAAAGSSDAAAAAAVPVSMPGLSAAAAFCETVGVLPPGSAAVSCKPPLQAFSISHQQQQHDHMPQQQQQQQSVQQLMSYTFHQPELLHQSLTHVSVLGFISYQRLEFLGDAVLDLMVSGWLMSNLAAALRQQQPNAAQVYAPAVLTQARAALVNNTNLGRAAAAAGLQHHINARSRPLYRKIIKFAEAVAGNQEQQQQQGGNGNVAGLAAAAAAAAAAASFWGENDRAIWQQVWEKARDFKVQDGSNGSNGTGNGADAVMKIQGDTAATAAAAEGSSSSSKHPKPPKALADLIESIVGAVFVDSMQQQQQEEEEEESSWEATWRTVRQLFGLN